MRSFLVVDDSRPVRMTLAATLRTVVGPDARVVEAENDEEAIAAFQTQPFDAVFLDMVLGDPLASRRAIQEILGAKPDAHVILTTGLDREHPDVVAAISDGAFSYLRKPIRAESVRSILQEIDEEAGRSTRIR